MHEKDRAPPERRSAGSLAKRRVQQDWPADRDFRILAIDGGGIKGIFSAAFLAGLERRFLGGKSISSYFDLITGTSTGGIIALGLARERTAQELLELYVQRGGEIFPPNTGCLILRKLKQLGGYVKYRYDNEALTGLLKKTFGAELFGAAQNRLCIPSFDGTYGEVYIFKTPHHPDFKKDAREPMLKVASATAAAPTFFQPIKDKGYTFVDGGVWANNPIMIGVVDALSCFNVSPHQIRVLSIGCSNAPYTVNPFQIQWGGLWHWRDIIKGAMHLQSLNAVGQAGLLIGAERLERIAPREACGKIDLDDWITAKNLLPSEAEYWLSAAGENIANNFLSTPTLPYIPLITV